jgi:hypothetical protein
MVAAAKTGNMASPKASSSELHRVIGWKDAFWVASGVPALVLFSIGGIAATVGTPSVLVWTLSVLFGFIQAFTYAEIAGLFPNKSGGASVCGAAAWCAIRRSSRRCPCGATGLPRRRCLPLVVE